VKKASRRIPGRRLGLQRLVEHEQFKNAAELLYQSSRLKSKVWSKPDKSRLQRFPRDAARWVVRWWIGESVPAGAGTEEGLFADRIAATKSYGWRSGLGFAAQNPGER